MATDDLKQLGIGKALGQLKHDLHDKGMKLVDKIHGVRDRGDKAFEKAHAHVDGQAREIKDVEDFVSEVEEATNGGPTLADSSTSSPASSTTSAAEPQTSWQGDKPQG